MSAPQVGDVITTAEELDALPAGAVVMDAFGKACQRLLDDGDVLRWWRCSHRLPHRPILPVVLLHLDESPARPERVVKAEALREAADAWQTGGWAEDSPPGQTRPALILGMAQRAAGFLRRRANAVEAGETR